MTRTNTNMSRYVYLTLTLSTCYISCTVQQSRKIQVGQKINDLHCANLLRSFVAQSFVRRCTAAVHTARACRQYDVRENRQQNSCGLGCRLRESITRKAALLRLLTDALVQTQANGCGLRPSINRAKKMN